MFVIPRMNGGGAERVVANLSNYFSKKHDVRIVAFASKESYYELNDAVSFCSMGCTIDRRSRWSTLKSFAKFFSRAVGYLRSNIREFKPDCVISFLIPADIITHIVTLRSRGVVKVYSERNDPTRRSLAVRMLLRQIYRRADVFVCQSRRVFEYYDFIPDDKKIVIANPIDITFLPEPQRNEENLDVVAVGRLSKQKNFEFLIESYAKIVMELPKESCLIIYGDGPERKTLEKVIAKNNLTRRVVLAGAQKNVLEKIKGSAVFVMPSRFEGFPNALLEAMAVGLPVISTDFFTGVARELVKKANGYVVPVGDVKRMAGAIKKMMLDEAFRKMCRKNNIKVRNEYSVEKIGDKWIKAIKNMSVKLNML